MGGWPRHCHNFAEHCEMKWTALSTPIRAMDTTAASWWQSRHNMKRPPQLTDLWQLARSLRGLR